MKLNAFTDVCLRVLMVLARRPDERATGQRIAEEIAVPYNHVSKAIVELRRRGAVDVARGRYGGAQITEVGLDLSVGSLVRDLASRTEVIDCTGHESGTPCPLAGACRLRTALHRAREAFLAELAPVTVRSLVAAGGPVALGLPALPPS
jgi:Rrf2 family transcriptional regulator, nitric oxide-sensitive transcriptional repressor